MNGAVGAFPHAFHDRTSSRGRTPDVGCPSKRVRLKVMSPHHLVLSLEASAVKSHRIRSARAGAAGSAGCLAPMSAHEADWLWRTRPLQIIRFGAFAKVTTFEWPDIVSGLVSGLSWRAYSNAKRALSVSTLLVPLRRNGSALRAGSRRASSSHPKMSVSPGTLLP
jgi:hypothetical protein